MHASLDRTMFTRVLLVAGAAMALWAAPAADAAHRAHHAARAHGAVVHVVKPGLRAHTNQSQNWFGYNQGTLEQGSKQFNAITGDWTVPTATQHTAGQDAASSDWIAKLIPVQASAVPICPSTVTK